MRLLFIGCSWTDHRTDEYGINGPYKEFAKLFKGRIDVIAHGGTSIDMHYHLLQQLDLSIYDFIIFQITAAQRGYFRKPNFKVLSKKHFQSLDNKVYEIRTYIEDNYEWYNPGWYGRLSKENYKHMKRKILEQPNPVEFEKEWMLYIYKVQKYLEDNNKNYIMYHHILDHIEEPAIIEKAKRFEVAEDWLGNNFKTLSLDKGHHLNNKGNKIVAHKLYSLYKKLTS